jgi:hypothetical protein
MWTEQTKKERNLNRLILSEFKYKLFENNGSHNN